MADDETKTTLEHDPDHLVDKATEIVIAYLNSSKHTLPPKELPALVDGIITGLKRAYVPPPNPRIQAPSLQDAKPSVHTPPRRLPRTVSETGRVVRPALPAPKVEEETKPMPAVPIAESVTDEYIVCLENGKQVRSSLRGYLKRMFGMTAEEYRKRWSLPVSYPFVPKNYTNKSREKIAVTQPWRGRIKKPSTRRATSDARQRS